MKKNLFIFLVFFCPLSVFSQNVEVEGGFIADSIDVNSGLIKNVADPISAQDASTKAYVDLLEAKVDLLLSILINNDIFYVQQRLDLGETPFEIYNSDNSLLDSLYGKTYQGGLIAYLETFTGAGLVAAPVDQSSGTDWGCHGVFIGSTLPQLFTGQANTSLIVNQCGGAGIAARLCDDLDDWGYDDWFLPSQDAVDRMYVNLKLKGLGGFANGDYWSSTEADTDSAESQYFIDGSQVAYEKSNPFNVRAVRAF